jgi:hypothetical protein
MPMFSSNIPIVSEGDRLANCLHYVSTLYRIAYEDSLFPSPYSFDGTSEGQRFQRAYRLPRLVLREGLLVLVVVHGELFKS